MLPNSYPRENNPSIDTLQFEVNPDTESSTESSTLSSSSDLEQEVSHSNVTEDNSVSEMVVNTDNSRVPHDSIFIGGQFNSVEYLLKSLYNSLESSDLDKSLVQQSQISGEMNSVEQELLKTIRELRDCLGQHLEKYEQLKRDIPEIIDNLKQSATLSKKYTEKMKKYYPVEYSKSKDKVLNRITNDEEDLYI